MSDILRLERVQRHATKYILNDYTALSYTERCVKLSILPLCYRREIIDLSLFYKYLHKEINCDFSSHIEIVNSLPGLRSAFKGLLLKLPKVKTSTHLSSYFCRLVHLWNALPRDIREANSLYSFKKYINQLYFSKLINFNIYQRCTWSIACTCGICHN